MGIHKTIQLKSLKLEEERYFGTSTIRYPLLS